MNANIMNTQLSMTSAVIKGYFHIYFNLNLRSYMDNFLSLFIFTFIFQDPIGNVLQRV